MPRALGTLSSVSPRACCRRRLSPHLPLRLLPPSPSPGSRPARSSLACSSSSAPAAHPRAPLPPPPPRALLHPQPPAARPRAPLPPRALERSGPAAAAMAEEAARRNGEEEVTAAEPRRLMRLANVEALKRRLGDGEVISYADLLRACQDAGVATILRRPPSPTPCSGGRGYRRPAAVAATDTPRASTVLNAAPDATPPSPKSRRGSCPPRRGSPTLGARAAALHTASDATPPSPKPRCGPCQQTYPPRFLSPSVPPPIP